MWISFTFIHSNYNPVCMFASPSLTSPVQPLRLHCLHLYSRNVGRTCPGCQWVVPLVGSGDCREHCPRTPSRGGGKACPPHPPHPCHLLLLPTVSYRHMIYWQEGWETYRHMIYWQEGFCKIHYFSFFTIVICMDQWRNNC